eukprot:15449534-Alexandrium_andersonii.AAC.1
MVAPAIRSRGAFAPVSSVQGMATGSPRTPGTTPILRIMPLYLLTTEACLRSFNGCLLSRACPSLSKKRRVVVRPSCGP